MEVKSIIHKKFDDTKWVIKSCNLKDRQYNGQQKKAQKDKWRSIKHYTELKIETHRGELTRFWRVSSSCSTSATRRVTAKWHEYYLSWKACWTPVYV